MWREVSANPRRTCAVDSGHVRVGHVQSLKKVRVAPIPKGSLKNLLDIMNLLLAWRRGACGVSVVLVLRKPRRRGARVRLVLDLTHYYVRRGRAAQGAEQSS